MTDEITPKAGERWRVVIEGTVANVDYDVFRRSFGLLTKGRDGVDCIHIIWPKFVTSMERLPDPEPEWQPGDLVLDAHGGVWRRRERGDDDVTAYPWIAVNAGDWETDWAPVRPLRRLVPEEK